MEEEEEGEGMCCQGQSAAAHASLVGGTTFPWPPGGRVGMIDQANGVPPLSVQAEAWADFEGAGVVVGVSLVDRLRSGSSSGGRREGGTRWSHECGILTRTSIRLSPA